MANPDIKLKRYILATMDTACSLEFIDKIHESEKLFIIINEVHRVGSMEFSKILSLNCGPCLGLSATTRYLIFLKVL